MDDAKVWLDILRDRIEKYNFKSDKLALATAYNQLGICFLNVDMIEEAKESWKQSLGAYKSVEDPPEFSGTFAAISLSLIYALQGKPEQGEQVIIPMLEEHERILGANDTSTTE